MAVSSGFVVLVCVAAPAVFAAPAEGSRSSAKPGVISSTWVTAAGDRAVDSSSEVAGATFTCPWLTSHDLKVIWSVVTTRRFPGVLSQWGSGEAHPKQGRCDVGSDAGAAILDVQVAVVPRAQIGQWRRQLQRRRELNPSVSTRRERFEGGVGVRQRTARQVGPRVFVTLDWHGGRAKKLTPGVISRAMTETLTRMDRLQKKS